MKRSEYEEYGISTWDDLNLLCYKYEADDIACTVYSKESYGELIDDMLGDSSWSSWRDLYGWLDGVMDVMDDNDGDYVIDDGDGLRTATEIDFESMVEEFVEYMDSHNLWEEEEEDTSNSECDVSARKLFDLMIGDKEESERVAEERLELWLERHHP